MIKRKNKKLHVLVHYRPYSLCVEGRNNGLVKVEIVSKIKAEEY